MTVRIDHSAPTISFSGTLTEQEALGTERPNYRVHVEALDGDPKAKPTTEPQKIRSGVAWFELKLDGEVLTAFAPENAWGNPIAARKRTLNSKPRKCPKAPTS
jgi:hypothetical protein